ncbi:helix-turn-helix domain-containing protein [Micromonospora sp. LOL_013]|uniref:helix-turn-helix domain-containing protein n=1 Tax=unclassified Micromonospora TaxID=2617518 RepID=UPI003A870623
MAEPVRARRLTQEEGRKLQQLVRRGKHDSVRMRRALIIMASASGTPVPAIARLIAGHEDTVRDVIHAFNEIGLRALDPQWAGGRPRRISDDDEAFIVATAKARPSTLGRPFTCWSLRKLADYLATDATRTVDVGRERLRQILRRNEVSWQRTRTWKESTDPDLDAKLDRIEEVTSTFPNRWRPDRLPATYRRTHGIRYFHGCYSLGDDQLWGVNRRRKGADHTLSALKSIRGARPDGAPIYVVLDNLSANKTPAIRAWAARNGVELCLTPTSASWANPIEAQFGPLRMFTMANSNHPNHTVLAREMQKYLRWRNANARHPDVLAAQRRERARVRSERQHRWGRPRAKAA